MSTSRRQPGLDEDLYRALELRPTATDAEIRDAFRRLARRYHPDVNHEPGAAERFRQVVAAYEVLSDPARRAAYDAAQRGAPASRPFSARPRPATGDARPAAAPPFHTDGPVRGLDRHATLRVPADVLEHGGTATIEHRRWAACARCRGSGILDEEVPCPECGGTGWRGRAPCRACWMSGTTSRCPDCEAKGTRWHPLSLEVRIPPGVRYGQQLRLRGMGDEGPRHGPPGDLYVTLAPPLPGPLAAAILNETVQAALRKLEEWLDRFAPYP